MKKTMISVTAILGLAVPAFGDTVTADQTPTGQIEERPGKPSSAALEEKTPVPIPTKNNNDTGGIGIDGGSR